jgi:Uma2 family endonuclease
VPLKVEIKVAEYLQHGVTVVLVVDPDGESVSVHRRLAPPLAVQGADSALEIGDLLPGFRDTLASIFK